MAQGYDTEQLALGAYENHVATVRAAPVPRELPAMPRPVVQASALEPGSVICGSLVARNPGWRLERPDGVPLTVTVTGTRPSAAAGRQGWWELVAKNAQVWEIRPASTAASRG
jgi:hypothetical protein